VAAAVTFRAPDLPRFNAAVREIERRGGDLSPLMDRIGQALVSSTMERFETEQAPDGARWAPSLRARTEGGKTLTKSAVLRGSITHIFRGDQVEVGTNVLYAGIHQEGGTIRPKRSGRLTFRLPGGLGFRSVAQVVIPARPFLGVSPDDEEEIVAQAEDYLAEVLS
jgi:phage virion morphogenesis protein